MDFVCTNLYKFFRSTTEKFAANKFKWSILYANQLDLSFPALAGELVSRNKQRMWTKKICRMFIKGTANDLIY